MAEINLLPWRMEQRDRAKKIFTWALGTGGIVSCSLVFLINCYVSFLVNNQSDRNQILQNEIAVQDQQIKEINYLKSLGDQLIARIIRVHHFQKSRIQPVHLFDELIKITPRDIEITRLEKSHGRVSLRGFSKSNTSISLLMSRMQANHWIQNPVLFEIRTTEEKTHTVRNKFILNFSLKQDEKNQSE